MARQLRLYMSMLTNLQIDISPTKGENRGKKTVHDDKTDHDSLERVNILKNRDEHSAQTQ